MCVFEWMILSLSQKQIESNERVTSNLGTLACISDCRRVDCDGLSEGRYVLESIAKVLLFYPFNFSPSAFWRRLWPSEVEKASLIWNKEGVTFKKSYISLFEACTQKKENKRSCQPRQRNEEWFLRYTSCHPTEFFLLDMSTCNLNIFSFKTLLKRIRWKGSFSYHKGLIVRLRVLLSDQ